MGLLFKNIEQNCPFIILLCFAKITDNIGELFFSKIQKKKVFEFLTELLRSTDLAFIPNPGITPLTYGIFTSKNC